MKTSKNLLVILGLGVVSLTPFSVSAFPGLDNVGRSGALLMQVSDEDKLSQGAEEFVDSMANRGIGFLGNDDLSEAQKKSEFRKLLSHNFDMKTIGRFALGRYWRSASEQQQDEYQALFEKMVIDAYARRFADYEGQAFDVRDSRQESEKDVTVHSLIVDQKNGSKIKVDWRVRYKSGQYKIIDVIVEGVSMGLTQRSDFSSVIQRGGGDIDVLLEHLRSE